MILLEFIRIYNKLTEEMGFVKLIKVYEHNGVGDFNFTSEFIYGSDIFMRETYRLEKLVDINSLPDYNKFIMNKKGEIFTTPTGLIVQKYFYLNYGNIDNVYVHRFENVVNVEKLNLLNKYIRFILLIKKKHHLPRPISYIIILALCELYFADIKYYTCSVCGFYLDKDKLCDKCDRCSTCNWMVDKDDECSNCKVKVCSNCSIGGECEKCTFN
jgi:hypothetical protein